MLRYPSPQPFQASDSGGGPTYSSYPQPPQQQPDIYVSPVPPLTTRDGSSAGKEVGGGSHWRAAGGKSKKLGAFLSSLSSVAGGGGSGKERPSEDGGRPSFDEGNGLGYQHYQAGSHRPTQPPAPMALSEGQASASSVGDELERLVGMLCALPPFALQTESERTVFTTTVQDVKWRLAHPSTATTGLHPTDGHGPGAADEEKQQLAERVGRRVRKELKDLPADVKRAEKEREKGEPGAADGGRRLGGGIAGVWWWLMLWGEDATVLRAFPPVRSYHHSLRRSIFADP